MLPAILAPGGARSVLTASAVNKTLPAYRRRTREVDARIAGAYLAGTNTRRVGRALTAVFRGAISKSAVSRVWRQIKTDWDSWSKRDLGQEDIVRLILDGTVVKVRLDGNPDYSEPAFKDSFVERIAKLAAPLAT